MSNQYSFIIDAMLGDLARWLRMMGYDALYAKDSPDIDIVKKALSERRILVTKDRLLYRVALKKGVKAILILSGNIEDKLYELASRIKDLNLDVDPYKSRCPICNGILVRVNRESVKNMVPYNVYTSHKEFWICTSCGKIYWKGGHWRGIEKTIANVKKKLVSSSTPKRIFLDKVSFLNRS